MSILKNFFTSFTPAGEHQTVKNISLISNRYIKNGFIMDLLPLVPLQMVFNKYTGSNYKLLYVIKVLRIIKVFKVVSIKTLTDAIKEYYKQDLDNKVKNNLDIANDINENHTNIEKILWISNLLKTLKLVIILFNTSYFVGIVWYIFCDLFTQLSVIVYGSDEH